MRGKRGCRCRTTLRRRRFDRCLSLHPGCHRCMHGHWPRTSFPPAFDAFALAGVVVRHLDTDRLAALLYGPLASVRKAHRCSHACAGGDRDPAAGLAYDPARRRVFAHNGSLPPCPVDRPVAGEYRALYRHNGNRRGTRLARTSCGRTAPQCQDATCPRSCSIQNAAIPGRIRTADTSHPPACLGRQPPGPCRHQCGGVVWLRRKLYRRELGRARRPRSKNASSDGRGA